MRNSSPDGQIFSKIYLTLRIGLTPDQSGSGKINNISTTDLRILVPRSHSGVGVSEPKPLNNFLYDSALRLISVTGICPYLRLRHRLMDRC